MSASARQGGHSNENATQNGSRCLDFSAVHSNSSSIVTSIRRV